MYKLAELKRQTLPMLQSVDCLAVPTVPRMYTLAEVGADPITLNSNLGSYTNFVNLLDLAAISVPVGRRSDGLPSSLTLIGPAGSDGYLASIGSALMGVFPTLAHRAPPGRIELAVVGAHLSGLPLNGELLVLGGTFIRPVETVPDYRLYALPGTTPPKPGLLRVAEGTGASIKAEIWALDPAGFGSFVAKIPSPLGVGTIGFTDGTAAKGFLVEAEATRNAKDISASGGWKGYLAGD
jgi:allophanate hydrolase